MIKSCIISSFDKNDIVKSRQIEKVNVVSDSNKTKQYASYIYNSVQSLISKKFKDFKQEVFVVGNENKEQLKLLKLIILLDSNEKIDYLQKNFSNIENDKKILSILKIQILNENYVKESLTEEKIKTQEWCDEIQNYLSNTFNIYVKTGIEASFFEKEVQSFWISASGKGIDDDIIFALKEISKAITLAGNISFYIDDKYTFIDNYFQR